MATQLGIEEIQSLMREHLSRDEGIKQIETSASNLEEALADASLQLGIPLRRLEYEILERGSSGFFGFGAKAWKIRAGEAPTSIFIQPPSAPGQKEKVAESTTSQSRVVSTDGLCFVQRRRDGVHIKVTKPVGKGKRATIQELRAKLISRNISGYSEAIANKIIADAECEYVRLCDYTVIPSNNGIVFCELDDAQMRASITLTAPGLGGCDLQADDILAHLRQSGVTHGILEDKIKQLEDFPRYKERICIAEATPPQHGSNATIDFSFNIDSATHQIKEASDGRMDFKELGKIQNVLAGQILAKKVSATKGQPGRTVTGLPIPATNGKDIKLPLGKNVVADQEGSIITSAINGQVLYKDGKISVEEIYTVPGDVNLTTGNIVFLGTVIVRGSVDDGFSIKAAGNIEVYGSVGKAEIKAEGDVIIHQGVAGKGSGSIVAGKSVWSKFIENSHVQAGDNVIVSSGLINCHIIANKRIICNGKRAAIVGGRYIACLEITAKTLGSPVGGAETILEVGYDPASKTRLEEIKKQSELTRKILVDLEKDIHMLNNMKTTYHQLSPEKEEKLHANLEKHTQYKALLESMAREIEELSASLKKLSIHGIISASGHVYPGVKLVINDIQEDVKSDLKTLSFILEKSLIRTIKYQKLSEPVDTRGIRDAQ